MKTLQEFQSDVSTLQTSVNDLSTGMDSVLDVVGDLKGQISDLKTQVSDLKSQLAAGSPVSQEDLDALDSQVNAIGNKVAEVHSKEDAAKS